MATEEKRGWGWQKLLILVLIALVVAGAGFFALTHMRHRDVLFYRKGQLHLDSGDPKAALESFRTALEKNPDLLAAQVGTVRAQLALREFGIAEQELDKAEKMGFPDSNTAFMRATIYAERAVYQIGSARSTMSLDVCTDVISKDLDPAIALVQKFAEKAEEPADAYSHLGDLLTRKSDVLSIEWQLHRTAADRAKSVGDSDLASQEGKLATEAVSQMGQCQRAAMAAYDRAVELDPKLPGPRLAIAQHALGTYVPQPERARKALEPLIAQTPDHRGARIRMASVERLEGNYDKALENVAAARKQGPDDPELLVAEGQILLDAERWDKLALLTFRLVQLTPSDPWANYLRGRALLKEPDPAKRKEAVQEAANCLQTIFQRSIVWPQARLALAQALDELGSQEQARSAYKHTVDDVEAGESINVRQGMESVGVLYEACMALYKAFKDENPKVAEDYAMKAFRARADQGDGYRAARAALVAAGKAPSEMEDLALAHSAAIILTGDMAGALAACTSALADPPAPGWGRRLSLLRARLLSRTGSYLEAVKAYEETRAKWSDVKAASSELAALHLARGRTAEAQAIYEDMVRSSPGDLDSLTALLELLVRAGKQEEARDVLAKSEQQLGPETTLALLLELELREGHMGQAVELGRSLVALDPQKAGLHVMLAELLWVQGDLAGARGAFDQALALDQAYLPAYRRALLDLQDGKADLATDLMRKAVKQAPEQPSITVQLAIAEQSGGDAAAAADLLQALIAARGTQPAALDALRWCLAVAHAGLGDAEKARAENQAVNASEIGPRDARQVLLDRIAGMDQTTRSKAAAALNRLVLFSRTRCLAATVQEAQAVQDLLPGDPLVACVQAGLLDAQGKHKEAAEAYQTVVSAHPDSVFARQRLAESLLGAGEKDAAARALEDALGRLAPDQAGPFRFQLGTIHQAQGQVDAAIADYKAAIADPQVLAVAANNMAWLLVSARNDPAAALPYAEQAAKAAPNSPAIADTLGWVYYLNGDAAGAIALLEKAKAGMGPNPTVRYHLGIAYLNAGRPDDAKSELREALAISDTFPEANEASKALGGL